MIEDPNSEETSSGHSDSPGNNANTAEKFRNPRATRNGPDTPGDQEERHRTDPEEDYAKPDGSERGGPGGPDGTEQGQR